MPATLSVKFIHRCADMRYLMMADGSVGGAGVTGNALPEDIQRFKDGGADRVLTKPLTKAKLMGTLQEYSAK